MLNKDWEIIHQLFQSRLMTIITSAPNVWEGDVANQTFEWTARLLTANIGEPSWSHA